MEEKHHKRISFVDLVCFFYYWELTLCKKRNCGAFGNETKILLDTIGMKTKTGGSI